MRRFSVGELYRPDQRQWPDGVHYSYREGGHELVFFFPDVASEEIELIRLASAEFALVVDPPVLPLCYRFGAASPWSRALFNYHQLPAEERSLPPGGGDREARARLAVLLVDATTGSIRTMRLVTFSPEFTARLHEAIREQADRPWDRAEYDRRLADLYRYTADDLAATAAAWCRGGSGLISVR
jgi:hypothetical protein